MGQVVLASTKANPSKSKSIPSNPFELIKSTIVFISVALVESLLKIVDSAPFAVPSVIVGRSLMPRLFKVAIGTSIGIELVVTYLS